MKFTRRKIMQFGLGASLLGGSSPWQSSLAQTSPLNMITVPSSGQQLPCVGIGTRNYRSSDNAQEATEFRETLETFHRLGGKVVDTSPNYGDSEQVIGNIMRELGIRNDLWVATKVDREEREAGIARMEESFRLLGGDYFELMQVHNLIGADVQIATMRAWKEQGRFRHIGVTTSNERQYTELEQIMQRHPLDFIQIDYALGNREADSRILPLAQDKGIAVLVNLPFGRGQMFAAVGDRPLPDWAAEIQADSWAQVFLKYIASHPGAVIPIPGTTKPHHAVDNLKAATGTMPNAELRREMERFIDPLLG